MDKYTFTREEIETKIFLIDCETESYEFLLKRFNGYICSDIATFSLYKLYDALNIQEILDKNENLSNREREYLKIKADGIYEFDHRAAGGQYKIWRLPEKMRYKKYYTWALRFYKGYNKEHIVQMMMRYYKAIMHDKKPIIKHCRDMVLTRAIIYPLSELGIVKFIFLDSDSRIMMLDDIINLINFLLKERVLLCSLENQETPINIYVKEKYPTLKMS